MPRENETGVAEWGIVFVAGYVAVGIAWLCGAGWWSLLAFPLPVPPYILSVLRRYSS
jgi:hypothetical protein